MQSSIYLNKRYSYKAMAFDYIPVYLDYNQRPWPYVNRNDMSDMSHTCT